MSKAKTVSIRARKDSSDTYGVRGAGQTWQAVFGMAIDEEDLLVAVKREPVANRASAKSKPSKKSYAPGE